MSPPDAPAAVDRRCLAHRVGRPVAGVEKEYTEAGLLEETLDGDRHGAIKQRGHLGGQDLRHVGGGGTTAVPTGLQAVLAASQPNHARRSVRRSGIARGAGVADLPAASGGAGVAILTGGRTGRADITPRGHRHRDHQYG